MMLAYRATAASDATRAQRLFASVTRYRLCSAYCHGGVVVGQRLYHANLAHGLHDTDWTPAHWDLIDVGTQRDADVLALYAELKGTPYDTLGVLGFGLPGVREDGGRLYCFEWQALALGRPPRRWETAESTLVTALRQGGRWVEQAQGLA